MMSGGDKHTSLTLCVLVHLSLTDITYLVYNLRRNWRQIF